MSETTPGASRRRVLKGAAWAAPAVVVATAVPAVAASGPALITTTTSGERFASNLGIEVTFSNANTGSTGNTLISVRLTPAGGTISGAPTNLSPGFFFNGASDLGNGAFDYEFFTDASGIPGTANGSAPAQVTTLSFVIQAANNTIGSISVTALQATGTVAPATGAWTTPGGGGSPV